MGSEDYQELVQDTTATAAAMIDAMEKSGKKPLPSSIAFYSKTKAAQGRRSPKSGRSA